MPNAFQYAGQVVFFTAAAALTGYFSTAPVYQQMPRDAAQIKLSFAHGAQRQKACRRLTTREIAALPPSERRPNTCDRERKPVEIELELDGNLIYEAKLAPTGLSRDGPSRTYRKFTVPTGAHTIVARLRDSGRTDGYDYISEYEANLTPWQNLAIDFKADAGGFIFR